MNKKMNKLFFLLSIIISLKSASCQWDDEFTPAPKCIQNENCFLPKCFCGTAKPPKNLRMFRKDQIPQLVVLTIDDDGLDVESYKVYKKLFEDLRNPNGQNVKGTFFLSDSRNETSYCLVRNLYDQLHEISISTVNYTCPHKFCNVAGPSFKQWKYKTWLDQILNMRERLNVYSGIPKSEIVGFRAPVLEPAADMHYRIIMGNKFLYDSSLIVNLENEEKTLMTWPFTLDYKIDMTVSNNGPFETYHGLWELPLPMFIGFNGKHLTCLKIWESWCGIDRSVRGFAKFLRSHFLRSYYHNRAPVVMHFNGGWLKTYENVTEEEALPKIGYGDAIGRTVTHERKEYRNLDGLIQFINNTLENNPDVYFVTAKQAIEWTKLLPTLKDPETNLTKTLEEKILFSTTSLGDERFDGNCDTLKPVLEQGKMSERLMLILDDTYGLKKDDLKKPKMNATVLLDLQSEVLFVNYMVIYFVIALMGVVVILIFYDRC